VEPGWSWRRPAALAAAGRELALTAVLVVLPVFVQAPWVRQAPFSAALFTAVLLSAGVLLNLRGPERLQRSGQLLVGFSGSWLAGSLFWGWARLHPLCHLPWPCRWPWRACRGAGAWPGLFIWARCWAPPPPTRRSPAPA
jgi:hypothetical protein